MLTILLNSSNDAGPKILSGIVLGIIVAIVQGISSLRKSKMDDNDNKTKE